MRQASVRGTQLLCLGVALASATSISATAGSALAAVGALQGQAEAATGQRTGPRAFHLEDSTPIKLRLQRTISSADAHVDDRVDFDVLEEIKVNDVVVIPKGSLAWGTVTEAQPKRRMGRGGKLNVNIDAVRLADGEKVPLRAVKDVTGGGHTGAMTGAMVATGIMFFPAAPLFLFMHGKEITIPKGTEITAFINGDTNLDPAKFGAKSASETPQPPPPTAAAVQPVALQPAPGPASVAPGNLATLILKPTPDGADVIVDGKYMGSTPSTVRLVPGDHAISIEKPGYMAWQRTLTVSPGGESVINPALQPRPKSLGLDEIIDLLKGAVPNDRVVQLVGQRGVSFHLDNQIEQKLREAGANEKLMLAIRKASDDYAASH